MIFRNPCTVKSAGVEHSPERQVATVAQVYELAAAVEPRYSALVLTAALTGCRWGELVGLTRRHLDLLHGTMTVAEALVEAAAGLSIGPPKSEAGAAYRRAAAAPPAGPRGAPRQLRPARGQRPRLLRAQGRHAAPQQLLG